MKHAMIHFEYIPEYRGNLLLRNVTPMTHWSEERDIKRLRWYILSGESFSRHDRIESNFLKFCEGTMKNNIDERN